MTLAEEISNSQDTLLEFDAAAKACHDAGDWKEYGENMIEKTKVQEELDALLERQKRKAAKAERTGKAQVRSRTPRGDLYGTKAREKSQERKKLKSLSVHL